MIGLLLFSSQSSIRSSLSTVTSADSYGMAYYGDSFIVVLQDSPQIRFSRSGRGGWSDSWARARVHRLSSYALWDLSLRISIEASSQKSRVPGWEELYRAAADVHDQCEAGRRIRRIRFSSWCKVAEHHCLMHQAFSGPFVTLGGSLDRAALDGASPYIQLFGIKSRCCGWLSNTATGAGSGGWRGIGLVRSGNDHIPHLLTCLPCLSDKSLALWRYWAWRGIARLNKEETVCRMPQPRDRAQPVWHSRCARWETLHLVGVRPRFTDHARMAFTCNGQMAWA